MKSSEKIKEIEKIKVMNSDNNLCLNCSEQATKKYCANCGQKTDTKRHSIKYILTHDILHGIFHIDGGFLYTLRELFTRPGHSIREYIQGKRIKHFHFFTFIIIALLIYKLVSSFAIYDLSDIAPILKGESFKNLEIFMNEGSKIFTLCVIPFQALISFLLFRKAKQNFSEHLVIASYVTGALLFFDLLFLISVIMTSNTLILAYLLWGIELAKIIYSISFFYQYFYPLNAYKKNSIVIRSILSSLLILISTYSLIYLIIQ